MSFAILVPHTTILGNSDLFIEAGSTINLTCIIQAESMRDTHIYWNYEGKVMSMKTYVLWIFVRDSLQIFLFKHEYYQYLMVIG